MKDKKIYYDNAYTYFKGTEEKVIEDKSSYIPNTYVAYVVDEHSNKTIEISYDSIGNNLSRNEGNKTNKQFLKILKVFILDQKTTEMSEDEETYEDYYCNYCRNGYFNRSNMANKRKPLSKCPSF